MKYPNVDIDECLAIIRTAPKDVITILILQDMGYTISLDNGISVIYQLMEIGAKLEDSPILKAYPEFVKTYFKSK